MSLRAITEENTIISGYQSQVVGNFPKRGRSGDKSILNDTTENENKIRE